MLIGGNSGTVAAAADATNLAEGALIAVLFLMLGNFRGADHRLRYSDPM
jgi:hypothetical protein